MMRHRFAAAIGLGLTLLLSAPSAHAGGNGSVPAKPTRTSSAPIFHIVATDSGFEAPNRVPAGIRHILFENHGKEIHEGMLVKLPAGMRAEGYFAAAKAGAMFPAGALDYAGAGLTSPGQTTELWTRLDPGQYIVICFNADHFSARRMHPFTVTAAGAHDDPLPAVDVVLKLIDYRFELSTPLRKGVQVIRVDTTGPSMHEADLYRLLDGKTLADVLEWRKHNGVGVAPAIAFGGMLDSHDLSHLTWLRKDFVPGRYVLGCEMPLGADAKPGTDHATHADAGMALEFDIAD